MPMMPERACPKCRRVGCTDPAHKPQPFAGARSRRLPRTSYRDSAEVERRRATVAAFLVERGFDLSDGNRAARCPDCGKVRTRFVADHVTPLAHGGREDGALRVHCAVCSGQQGAKIANERMARPS